MRLIQALSLVLLPALAAGCASPEKKDSPSTAPAAALEGKPKAPALDVAVAATPGPSANVQHLVMDVVARQEGQLLTAEFRLPEGVTAVDAAGLKAEVSTVTAGSKHSFPVDVTLDAATPADVVCVVTLAFGGSNKDTVTRTLHLGPAATPTAVTPSATGTDSTGKPVREARPIR
jgi:hypothetical protein